MKNVVSRRGFVNRMSIALSSVMAVVYGARATPRTATVDPAGTEPGPDRIVKKIWPLGFQWKTSDPFLFCVHHEDF
ncbi:MAG: pirin family protein, partial [Bacteroidetes bacterium]|nr:pirin family protein [Bacteroidota bacterium]